MANVMTELFHAAEILKKSQPGKTGWLFL